MIFEYNNNKFSINCDWLQYSVIVFQEDVALRQVPGYRIELCQGNNIFRRRAIVYDNMGRKYLTLMWCPYSSRLNSMLMTVQVANELLYGGMVHESFRLLQCIVDCHFNSMGRIDLCCDFEINEDKLKMLNDINDGSLYVERKKEGSSWWHAINAGNGFFAKQCHCLTWGSQSSEIKVKVYCKSRELGLIGGERSEDSDPVEHKPYIVAEWKLNKMNIKKVWRIEFSLSGANQLRTKNQAILLDHVASSEWQLNTFFGLYHKRFVIRKNQGLRSGHHNTDERVYLIDLPKNGNHLTWFPGNPPSPFNSNAIPIVRAMMNKITEPAIMANDEVYTSYACAIQQIVASNGLFNWFRNRFGSEVQSYFELMYQSVGCQIVEDYVDAKKFFD